MRYQFPEFTLIYMIAVGLCLLLAAMTWKRRNSAGGIPAFVLLMLALAIWSFTAIFEAGSQTVSDKVLWSEWQYLGITTVSPLWVFFSADFTGRKKKISTAVRWLIWVIPLVTLLLVFTNEYHGLIWKKVSILPGSMNIGYYQHAVACDVHIAYSYLCLLIGTIWLIKDAIQKEKKKKIQSVVLIIGVIISWIANFLYVMQLFPITGLDITPLSFSLVAFIMAWNIFRFQLFDLVPKARNALLISMKEGVILVDANDKILEVNPAALEILNYQGSDPTGISIWELLGEYKDVIKEFNNQDDISKELVLRASPLKVIELQISRIEQKKEDTFGQLIVMRDITERKKKETRERDQHQFTEALADTAAAVNSSLDLDIALEKILENVTKVVPHEAATIALITEEGKAKYVQVKNPEKYGSMHNLLSLDLNMKKIPNFMKMAETHKGVVILDTYKDKNWNRNIKGSEWIRSFVGAPIIFDKNVLGFISLDTGTPDFYTSEHLERLELFANYTATALTNANLYTKAKLHAEEMSILYEISMAVSTGVGLEKTTRAVFQQLKKIIPIDLFYLALYEPVEKVLSYFMYRENGERIDIKPFFMFKKQSLTRYVMEKQQTIYIPDFNAKDSILKEDEVIKVAGYENRTVLGIPLILRGEVMGVLSMQSARPNAYSQDQIRLLETIARQTSISMDNAKLFEKMQAMAITDSLTGLFNRRYFYMILEKEIERAKRYTVSLSLIMLDIDHFKMVNDRLGHLAGDEVLALFADVCKRQLRQSDIMFRYGGEEFTILLPETSKDEAINVAERIRIAIADTTFQTEKGDVHITTSLGVAEYGEKYSEINEFVESADKAMYEAKEAGRNRVKFFS